MKLFNKAVVALLKNYKMKNPLWYRKELLLLLQMLSLANLAPDPPGATNVPTNQWESHSTRASAMEWSPK